VTCDVNAQKSLEVAGSVFWGSLGAVKQLFGAQISLQEEKLLQQQYQQYQQQQHQQKANSSSSISSRSSSVTAAAASAIGFIEQASSAFNHHPPRPPCRCIALLCTACAFLQQLSVSLRVHSFFIFDNVQGTISVDFVLFL
jgi:hypothetical protein